MDVQYAHNASVLDRIKTIVQCEDRFLITTHIHPDGDSLASVLVFSRLFDFFKKSFRIYLDDAVPKKYDFLPGTEMIERFDEKETCLDGFEYLIVLDSSGLDRIGRIPNRLPKSIRIVNIDHHPANGLFGALNYVDAEASSTAEIVYDLYRRSGAPLTREVAELVYAGIVSDTGCFRFGNTNAHSLETGAEMVRAGAVPKEIVHFIYERNSAHTLQALGRALTRVRFFLDGRVVGMSLTYDETRLFSEADTEGFVNYLLLVDGPETQFFMNEITPGCHRVSLRSRTMDVNRIAHEFGGGGHAAAAGCYIEGDGEEAQDLLLQSLSVHFKEEKAA